MRSNPFIEAFKLRQAFAALACCAALIFAGQASAQNTIVTQVDSTKHAGEFVVPLNKSQILRVDVPFADLLVGNPEVADVLALTDRSVYVLGKALGSTNLTIYGRNKNLLAVVDLVVAYDIEGLKQQLFQLMPDEQIEVRAVNGAIALSGIVSGAGTMSRALAVAQQYAPDAVTNLMSVKGSQQVLLKVRFAEMSRQVGMELGLSNSIVSGDSFTFLSGFLDPTAFANVIGDFAIGGTDFQVALDAMEQKGLVKILAEPNLIALSGDTANFLAGGEFPVPIAQDSDTLNTTITVEFKEFGVSLAFTPTVLDDGLINLVVAPEVSQIDLSNAVELSGFRIPGLTVRRATTTVELRDGQAFAIAGLLQSDFRDTVTQFPGLADIPVLGALLRSTDFQQSETELVIIIEPHLAKPAPANALVTPADNFVPPSPTDLWFFGRTESTLSPGYQTNYLGAEALSVQSAGGIQGAYGHIVK
ncbi:MAG: type II and III secretion system protein family protein [Pseudomonadota bacterium]